MADFYHETSKYSEDGFYASRKGGMGESGSVYAVHVAGAVDGFRKAMTGTSEQFLSFCPQINEQRKYSLHFVGALFLTLHVSTF